MVTNRNRIEQLLDVGGFSWMDIRGDLLASVTHLDTELQAKAD